MSETADDIAATPPPERGRSVKGDEALNSLEFGSRTTGAAAAARSRLVRRLRIALPILAVALVALFIINTRSNSVDQAFLDDFKSIAASTEELRMANPTFAGVDAKGRPYQITAVAASQDPGARDIVELESPRAIQGGDDASSLVTAATGVYRTEDNILELVDDVTFEHLLGADRYELRAPKATVLIEDQVVVSDDGVDASGPDGGALSAERMTAYRGDGRVVFEGNVSMRIYPKSDSATALKNPTALRDGETAAAKNNNDGDSNP
ncbi:MAG: LPS export ABC transporter periplasmic protein LptC [Pseudomonadota bacterium]